MNCSNAISVIFNVLIKKMSFMKNYFYLLMLFTLVNYEKYFSLNHFHRLMAKILINSEEKILN